jgi:hypothetical protein
MTLREYPNVRSVAARAECAAECLRDAIERLAVMRDVVIPHLTAGKEQAVLARGINLALERLDLARRALTGDDDATTD